MKLNQYPSASAYSDWQGFLPESTYKYVDESTMPNFFPPSLSSKFEYIFAFASGTEDYSIYCVYCFRRDREVLDEHPWISIWDKTSGSELGSFWVDHGNWMNRSIPFVDLDSAVGIPADLVRKRVLNLPIEEEGRIDSLTDQSRFNGFHSAADLIFKEISKKILKDKI